MALVAPLAMALMSLPRRVVMEATLVPRALVNAEMSLPMADVAPFRTEDTKLPTADVAPPTTEVMSPTKLVLLGRTEVRNVLGTELLRLMLRLAEIEMDDEDGIWVELV